jgi:hypothetical protein
MMSINCASSNRFSLRYFTRMYSGRFCCPVQRVSAFRSPIVSVFISAQKRLLNSLQTERNVQSEVRRLVGSERQSFGAR